MGLPQKRPSSSNCLRCMGREEEACFFLIDSDAPQNVYYASYRQMEKGLKPSEAAFYNSISHHGSPALHLFVCCKCLLPTENVDFGHFLGNTREVHQCNYGRMICWAHLFSRSFSPSFYSLWSVRHMEINGFTWMGGGESVFVYSFSGTRV